MKLEICAFSGHKIYPGRGKLYVRIDSRSFRFVNNKNASLFLQRKNPRRIHWTVVFRKMHKKGITEEASKKRSRKTVKHTRAIVGASLEVIKERRGMGESEKEKLRKEAVEKAKAAKAAQQAAKKKKAVVATGQPQQKAINKNVKVKPSKGAASSKR